MPPVCLPHGWPLGWTGLQDVPVLGGSEQAWTQRTEGCVRRNGGWGGTELWGGLTVVSP